MHVTVDVRQSIRRANPVYLPGDSTEAEVYPGRSCQWLSSNSYKPPTCLLVLSAVTRKSDSSTNTMKKNGSRNGPRGVECWLLLNYNHSRFRAARISSSPLRSVSSIPQSPLFLLAKRPLTKNRCGSADIWDEQFKELIPKLRVSNLSFEFRTNHIIDIDNSINFRSTVQVYSAYVHTYSLS